jgi:hypothetical protein
LWSAVTDEFELSEAEQALLLEAARTRDELDLLAAVVARQGVMDESGRVSPALVESRQLRLALTRLLASLRMPDPDGAVPQRRGASRGAYGVRS